MTERIRIHLASGHALDAVVDTHEDVRPSHETLEEYVRHQLKAPPTPHWTTLGDVEVFTQAVQAVEYL